MPSLPPNRTILLAGALLAAVAVSHAQSLTGTAPTRPATVTPAVPAHSFTPARRAGASNAADIRMVNGRLAIVADNASLNQILRDISQLNGMKITGNVTEERVYGTYGPKSASAVIADLLDGTRTNVLVRENAQHAVVELVLTPRAGGPTPARGGAGLAQGHTGEADTPPVPGMRRTQNGLRPTAADETMQTPPEAEQPATDTPEETPADAPTTEEQSPNGVKTPQQIYDQIQKLQDPSGTPENPTGTPDNQERAPENMEPVEQAPVEQQPADQTTEPEQQAPPPD